MSLIFQPKTFTLRVKNRVRSGKRNEMNKSKMEQQASSIKSF